MKKLLMLISCLSIASTAFGAMDPPVDPSFSGITTPEPGRSASVTPSGSGRTPTRLSPGFERVIRGFIAEAIKKEKSEMLARGNVPPRFCHCHGAKLSPGSLRCPAPAAAASPERMEEMPESRDADRAALETALEDAFEAREGEGGEGGY